MMNFRGMLRGLELETMTFAFDVEEDNVIQITKVQAPFEHFFLQLFNPTGQMVALFTFKSRHDSWRVSNLDGYGSSGSIPCGEMKGRWQIKIVSPSKITGFVELEVSTYLEEAYTCASTNHPPQNTMKRWYRGDLHLHTNLSDGRIQIHDVEKAFHKSNLDFLSITDHSVLLTQHSFPQAQLLLGTEITWDNNGHYNIHGIESLEELNYDRFIQQSSSKMSALTSFLESMHRKGRVLTLNHPFPYTMSLAHSLDVHVFTCIEVLNAPHLMFSEVDNQKAIAFFDFLWRNGHRLTAVGGSDAHKENYYNTYPIGTPTTHIYCDGLCSANLLRGLKKGNTLLTCFENIELVFRHNGHEVIPGDRCNGPVSCYGRCPKPIEWRLMRNGNCVETRIGSVFQTQFTVEDNNFYRLEAYDSLNACVLFTNPIHAMRNKPTESNLLALIGAFEKERSYDETNNY